MEHHTGDWAALTGTSELSLMTLVATPAAKGRSLIQTLRTIRFWAGRTHGLTTFLQWAIKPGRQAGL